MLLRLLLLPFLSSSGACITLQERNFYAPIGDIKFGCIVTHLIGHGYEVITADECIEKLNAETSPPAHGASLFMTDSDTADFILEHQEMCRMLKNKCSYSTNSDNATPTPAPN